MELKKLVTLAFDRNVGPVDRVFRLTSGGALAGAGGYLDLHGWASATMITAGLLWMLTGVLSKCSIYYLLGYSTCPARSSAS